MSQNSANSLISTLITLILILGFAGYSLVNLEIVSGTTLVVWLFLLLVIILLLSGLKIVDQYERGVVLDIPQQEAITKDNVPVGINAVVYFNIESAENAILNIQDYTTAVSNYAQAALRDVIGGIELDSLLSEREKIAQDIKQNVDEATKAWGLNVTDIKIQDIELPADMKRVMAKQAESERERRAVIIKAEGEYSAAERLAQAAERLSAIPGGLSMRTLQTIEKINPDPSKTVIFALPIEFFEGIKSLSQFLKEKTK